MAKKINQMAVRYRSLADGDGIAFKWESSLDKILTAGNYAVKIEHYGADVGLPIEGCGTEHSIAGTLVVTDSGALDKKQGDRVIGQVLTFTLRKSKETSIYTRTYAGGKWGAWYSLARTGMYDEITNADALYSTVTSLVSATKKTEESLHSTIINYNEWKGNNYELSLPNVLADDEFVKMVKSGTILIFKNTSTIWKRFQYAAASVAVTDVKNYSNWKELSGTIYGIKQAVDAHKVQISTTGENGGVKDILNIAAATAENAGVMSAEDKKMLQYGCGSDLAGEFLLEGWITPTGYFTENADYRATDFVALNRNNALVAIGGFNSSAALITFYDSDKKYIAGYNQVSEKIILPAEFPEDAVYFRCSVRINALDTIKVYNASIASVTKKLDNLETNFDDTEKDVAELTLRTDSIVSELYPVTVITFPNIGYITKEGLVYGTDGYSRHSDKIPIKNILEIYSSAVIGANVHAIIFYDKDGGVISGVEGDATNAVGTLSFTEEQLKADSFRVQFYANSEAMAEKRSICYVTRYMQLPTSVRVNNLENDVAELIKGADGVTDEITRIDAAAVGSLQVDADAEKVTVKGTSLSGKVVATVDIPAATTENAGVMSAEDKKLLQYGCGSDLAGEFLLEGWITPTGYFTENADYRATDFVALNRNNALVAIGGFNSSAALITFYDSDKKYIAGYNQVSEKIILPAEFPEDAVYFRCSVRINALDTIKVYNASIASVTKKLDNLETNFDDTEKDVAELTLRTDSIVSELYPVTVITFPNIGYITKEGLVYGTDGYSRHSDKIPIKNILEIYSSAVIGANVHAIIFYDKDGGVISGVEGDATNAVGTLSFTEEQLKADSFRVQFYANSEAMAEKRSICYVTRYMQLPTSVRVNNLENDVAELIKGNGLKVLIFGDSITTNADFSINENHQTTAYTFKEKGNGYEDENGNWVSFSMWPYLMTKYLSCSDVRNYAQNGASYTERERESGYERQNLSYQVKLALNDRTNPNGAFTTDGDFVPDVIIFALGTNDGNPNDTYDSAMAKTVTLADGKTFDVEATLANLDVTKTCEAMRYAFLKVKQAFPQSLCLCVLPIQRANTENLGINDVLEKMAKRYSIKIVDGYSELGVVRDLEIWNGFGTNLKDGLHPNDKGQKLYTRMMVNAIKNNWLAL